MAVPGRHLPKSEPGSPCSFLRSPVVSFDAGCIRHTREEGHEDTRLSTDAINNPQYAETAPPWQEPGAQFAGVGDADDARRPAWQGAFQADQDGAEERTT